MTLPVRPRPPEMNPALEASLSGTNLERAGDHNQRVTLQAIRVRGPVTRVELAEITGLTAPAIANITRRLLTEGLILEAGRLLGQRGQPAMRLEINPDGAFSVGVNIDRDHVTLVVLDLLGRVRARASRDIAFALPLEVADFCAAELPRMLEAGGVARDRLLGIGVALPDDLGSIRLPGQPETYAAWNRVDLPELFRTSLPGLPLFRENDATAAALGELQFGLGLHEPNFFYLLISRGLGGGLVVDGHYVRGTHGRSGEIGFLPLPGRHERGCLQDVVSLSALVSRLERAGHPVTSPTQLTNLAGPARHELNLWLQEATEQLTGPLLAVSCIVDPQAIFLGGRLPAPLLENLAQGLNGAMERQPGIPVRAPVRRAALSDDAPAMGAAILPFSHHLLPSRSTLMKNAVG